MPILYSRYMITVMYIYNDIYNGYGLTLCGDDDIGSQAYTSLSLYVLANVI